MNIKRKLCIISIVHYDVEYIIGTMEKITINVHFLNRNLDNKQYMCKIIILQITIIYTYLSKK